MHAQSSGPRPLRAPVFVGACWLCCLVAAGGGEAPRLEPAPVSVLPPGVWAHAQSAGIGFVNHDLGRFLQRLSAGESTAPGTPLVRIDAPGRLRGRTLVADKQASELAMVAAAFVKIPLRKLSYFLRQDRGVRLLVFAPVGAGGKADWALLLPVAHFDELLAAWRADEVTRYLVSRQDNAAGRGETYVLAHPHYGPLYLRPCSTDGVVVGASAAAVGRGKDVFAAWRPKPLNSGPDLRILVNVAAVRTGWTRKIKGGAGRAGGNLGFAPRYVQALLNLPSAIPDTRALPWRRVARVRCEVYFTPASLFVESAWVLTPATGTPQRADAVVVGERGELLEFMPEATTAWAETSAPGMVRGLLPLLETAALDAPASKHGKPGPLVTRLLLERVAGDAVGPAALACVRGSNNDLALLVAFRTRAPSRANAFLLAARPHLGQFASAGAQGAVVCLALGLEHRQLLAGYLRALERREARFGRRLRSCYWSGDMPGRGLLRGGVLPVDLAKALIGEMLVLARVYGMPVATGNFGKQLFASTPDSCNPLVFGVSADNRLLRLSLSVPAGAYRDVALTLQRIIFRFHDQQTQVPEKFLDRYLDALARKLMRRYLRRSPPPRPPARK